jgi:hypothetical protein
MALQFVPVQQFVPLHDVQIRKGKVRGDANVAQVEGIASTEHEDHEGQTLLQKGMDWSYFLREGWINYEHEDPKHATRGAAAVIGYPVRVWSTTHEGKPATGLEARLFLDDPRAAQVVQTLEAIQKAIPARQLGFSIEGDAVDVDNPKDPKVIKRAVIYNVTLTSNPVNGKARISRVQRDRLRKALSLGLGDLGIPRIGGEEGDDEPQRANPLHRILEDHFHRVMRESAARLGRSAPPLSPWGSPLLWSDESSAGGMSPAGGLFDAVDKGGIGYQAPSQPSGEAFSALVPQSIEGAPRRRKTQSLAQLLASLYNP